MVNIKFFYLIVIGITLCSFSVFALGLHEASEIKPGTFMSGDYTFNGDVFLSSGNDLCIIGGICLSSASGGSSSLWSESENNLYFITGNVGIGTINPKHKLEVKGNISINGTGNGIIFPDGSKLTSSALGISNILINLNNLYDVEPNNKYYSHKIKVRDIASKTLLNISGDGNPKMSVNGGNWQKNYSVNNSDIVQFSMDAPSTYKNVTSSTISFGNSKSIWNIVTASKPATINYDYDVTWSSNYASSFVYLVHQIGYNYTIEFDWEMSGTSAYGSGTQYIYMDLYKNGILWQNDIVQQSVGDGTSGSTSGSGSGHVSILWVGATPTTYNFQPYVHGSYKGSVSSARVYNVVISSNN